MNKARALVTLVALIALAACGSDSKIGSTVKGKRIAILEQSHKVEPDKDLSATKPVVPPIDVVKDWSQNGFDAAHKEPNAAIEPKPKEIWTSGIGEGSNSDFKLLAPPVTGNGMVFTMDAQGNVRAFDDKTGDRIWEFDTTPKDRDENAVGGGLAFDTDTLYATTGFGEVLAINPNDGKVFWRKMLLNPIRGAPTIFNEHVYIVSIDNELQALDAKTGEVLWHHRGITESATLMGASSPAATTDSVIAAYSSGEIFSLIPQNGRVAWSYTLTVPTQVGAMPAIADIRGLPVVNQGRVYAISHSGRVAAIDARTGDRVWEADIGGVFTPIVAGDAVFIFSNDSELIALARDSGRVIWVQSLPKFEDPDDRDSDRISWAGPVLAANRLWLVNSQGNLISFAVEDGKQLDTIELGSPIYIPPIIANNTMYVVLDSGRLVTLK